MGKRIKHVCHCGSREETRYCYSDNPNSIFNEELGLKKWEGTILCGKCLELVNEGEWKKLKDRFSESG